MKAAKLPEEYRSIENMEANTEKVYMPHEMKVVGEKRFGQGLERKFVFMVDPAGLGWYETMVLVNGKWVTQEEAVFGKRIKRKRQSA